MGSEVPKQFLDWGGVPLLKATINAFFSQGMPIIDGIAVALPPDRIGEVSGWKFPAPHWCTEGGETRQQSVYAAIKLLPDCPSAIVLIHDAGRPFPPPGPIAEAIELLNGTEGWEGAALAEPSTDTLKKVGEDFQVLATVPREHYFRAQTPQLATLATWRKAFGQAECIGFTGTDDLSVLEAMGLKVRVVISPPSNQKLTSPDDWERLKPRA